MEGIIAGVKTFPDNKSAPVLLNLGADFPNQLLTIAVFDSYQSETRVMHSETQKRMIAIVFGKIELYQCRQLNITKGETPTPVKN